MRGRYYARHTVYHTVDNRERNKRLNENYKKMLKQQAIDYLKKSNDSIDKKVDYLRSLTHDTYRYGTKYKYECNLKSTDISYIIRSANDEELFKAYFGRTIKEDNELNMKIMIGLGLASVLIIVLFIAFKG